MIELHGAEVAEVVVHKVSKRIDEVLSGCIAEIMQSDCIEVTRLKAIKLILERWA